MRPSRGTAIAIVAALVAVVGAYGVYWHVRQPEAPPTPVGDEVLESTILPIEGESELTWRKSFAGRFRVQGRVVRSADGEAKWTAIVGVSFGDWTGATGPARAAFVPPKACKVVFHKGDTQEVAATTVPSWGGFALSIREEHYLAQVSVSPKPGTEWDHVRLLFQDGEGNLLFNLAASREYMESLPKTLANGQ